MKIVILGSTGSIGKQTLDVADSLYNQGVNIEITGLSANTNVELLAEQIIKYHPKSVVLMDERSVSRLHKLISRHGAHNPRTKILMGQEGLLELCRGDSALVVNALVGNIGLLPTIEAIRNGKDVALANKECLVTSGEIIINEAKKNNVNILPIDSEHSAVMQCLSGSDISKVRCIYLTASGGPFRLRKSLEGIKPKEALEHPVWKMGSKISVDSATMMNKGLEVIEAKWLFGVDASQIKVIIHPQGVIHSMVEFTDGVVIAQLGQADMRIPIQYALTYPKRIKNDIPSLDFFQKSMLTFEKTDTSRFKCLALAYEAIRLGGTIPAVMNAADEVAVKLFLEEKLDFADIPHVIERAMLAYNSNIVHNYNISDVERADTWARAFVENQVRR